MKKLFLILPLIIFTSLILFLSLRGLPGNPTAQQINERSWKENGPLELSPERGRFALMYSVIEDESVHFSTPLARFVTPDVAYSNDNYVSLFAPALSYLAIPGYLIGKDLGASQVGAFATISVFALLNFLLIYIIALKLKANKFAAALGSISFLFATPAFAYGVNLYQHHVTTLLILLSTYLLIRFDSFWSFALIFFLFAFAVPLDYPNLVFMFPIALYAGLKTFKFIKQNNKLTIEPQYLKILSVSLMALPLAFFLWFNTISYGAPFNMLGSSALAAVESINPDGSPKLKVAPIASSSATINKEAQPTNGLSFFQTRRLLNGFQIHFFSWDRGIVHYAPVILLGFIGMYIAYQKRTKMLDLFVAIIGLNILLYSMWADPWGGYAFGSRYLIPSYALLAIFTAIALTYLRKNIFFLVLFSILLVYSISINTLGAITSSANPPQVEVLTLEAQSGIEQKYTYERNFDLLMNNTSKSYVFQTYLKEHLTAFNYYLFLVTLITAVSIYLILGLRFLKGDEHA